MHQIYLRRETQYSAAAAKQGDVVPNEMQEANSLN